MTIDANILLTTAISLASVAVVGFLITRWMKRLFALKDQRDTEIDIALLRIEAMIYALMMMSTVGKEFDEKYTARYNQLLREKGIKNHE